MGSKRLLVSLGSVVYYPKMDYDFELGRVVDEIKKSGARVVGLQFPEGLKQYALDVAREIEKRSNAVVLILADPCYGPCDTKELEAKRLNIDLLVQFGHDRY